MTATVLVAAAISLPVSASAAPSGFTGIDGGSRAAGWTHAVDGPQPYSDIIPDLSVPITMDDGTVLKADVLHPGNKGRAADKRLPTILQFQGYGKTPMLVAQAVLKIPGIQTVLLPWLAQFKAPESSGLAGITDLTRQLDSGALPAAAQTWDLANAGYNLVQVDLRGTGDSDGYWQTFGARERKDSQAVIDWVSHQPWSNGKIGLIGTSFTGITALQAASYHNPAVKAVFAYVPSADIADDIAVPGGGIGVGFAPFWLLVVNLCKDVPDVESLLTGKFNPAQQLQWLKDRLADPATMLDVMANAYGSLSVNQLTANTRSWFDPTSAFRRGLQTNVSGITAPIFMIDAWFDIFGTTATDTYNKLPLPLAEKKIIMGDGYHEGAGVAGFGHPGMPPRLDVLQRAWFDKWLKGINNGIDKYSPITVKPEGAEWTSLPAFPLPDATYRRMYFNDRPTGTAQSTYDGGLSTHPIQTRIHNLSVTPSLLSLCSRDTARITAGATSILQACTEDSRIWEHAALTFTSAPVNQPTNISGPIDVHLNAVENARDGYWAVTLNDVAPDGQSREISDGQLTASLRQIDVADSLTSPDGDYTEPHYYVDLNRRQPTTPGQPVTLEVGLTPIEAVLQPGHRLRVDVYASNFPKGLPPTPLLVDSKLAPETLRLDPKAPSWVNVALSTGIPE
ncbi:CocE/NonD family hydrolase [Gordonia polyisoprenivorans]|uniref:CocE/NonD family hydrolase n=1 Tax=Gordonia polyisoprenivorans TaxID=84595 RepID=UPI0003A05263|nr:CocE/NonD family hydrolase [Gordonia polyisoprenivorans]